MTHSLPYRMIAWLLNALLVVGQIIILFVVASITGQTFQRTRNARPTLWPRYEM